MRQGLSLAFVYIGLVIGAGFASGREIMEYFNVPTQSDHRGVVLATLLLIAVCYLILRRAWKSQLVSCTDYLSAVCGSFAPWANRFILFYLFCGFFTMLAGCGALLNQSFLLPPGVGSLILLLLCFVVLSFDLKGIVALNAVLVPCMIAGILLLCISSITEAAPVFSMRSIAKGTLLSAVCYVSYNTISAPSVLVPLAKGITPRSIRIASLTGGLVLGTLILLIWLCQSVHFGILKDSEIPLLQLAAMAGRTEKYLYTAVLFMAICTTAVSEGFGVLAQIRFRSGKERLLGTLLFCFAAYPFSLLGFSDLVANLYAFFGIAGLVWMVWLFIDAYRHR